MAVPDRASVRAVSLALAACLLVFAAACAPLTESEPPPPTEPALSLRPVSFDALPGWAADRHGEALAALLHSCRTMLRQPADRRVGGQVPRTIGDWHGACEAASAISPRDHRAARLYFEDWFSPFEVTDSGAPGGLFTGYFEPELDGALVPDNRYHVPLFARPRDLVSVDLGAFREDLAGTRIAGRVDGARLVPYHTRAEIDAGALASEGVALVWVDDPVDAFFLQIQGSGRIRLADGSYRRIGYAAANGHSYYAIGRTLIATGEVAREDMSMQAIRHWLETNPARADALMHENASYVFFRWVEGLDAALGPLGAQGVPLTAGRSLAVDRRFLAFGLPIWLEAGLPRRPGVPAEKTRRLVIAQDTGGAIRGVVRGDLFIGTGDGPGEIAGRMRESGRYWALLPRLGF